MPNTFDPLTVVMACDEGYAMPLATSLRSLAESNKSNWPLTVHVMTDRFSDRARKNVAMSLPEGAIKLYWLSVDLQSFDSLPTLIHISQATFARLLVSEILPRTLRRFIYIDADTLVLRDLGELWRLELRGRCVAAVNDAWFGSESEKANLPDVEEYFNAGVMLVDLNRWTTDKIGLKALQYLTDHPRTPFADQDALNYALDRNWIPISNEWNFQGHISIRIQSMPNPPAIVHFVTVAKPWLRSYGTPNEALFDSFRRRTRFSRSSAECTLDLIRSLNVFRKRQVKKLTNLLTPVISSLGIILWTVVGGNMPT
jgi:lipopolysaccharide biosynthesis glycosyltransferase